MKYDMKESLGLSGLKSGNPVTSLLVLFVATTSTALKCSTNIGSSNPLLNLCLLSWYRARQLYLLECHGGFGLRSMWMSNDSYLSQNITSHTRWCRCINLVWTLRKWLCIVLRCPLSIYLFMWYLKHGEVLHIWSWIVMNLACFYAT